MRGTRLRAPGCGTPFRSYCPWSIAAQRNIRWRPSTETVDGRSVDECLWAHAAGTPQDLTRRTFGGILSPYRMGFAAKGWFAREAAERRFDGGGSSLGRRCITFSLSAGIAMGAFPMGSQMDSSANFLNYFRCSKKEENIFWYISNI